MKTQLTHFSRRMLTSFVVICLLLFNDIDATAQKRSRSSSRLTQTQPTAQLGINLNGPVDWNSELPLVDVFRLSRRWISQRDGESWGKGPKLKLDEHGWVTELQPNCSADAMLCTIQGGHVPTGRYTVLYDGEGTIQFKGGAKIVKSEPGRMEVDVSSGKRFYLHLTRVNPQNYVRNIHVIMPGFEDTWQTNIWHPSFLKRWEGFACLRFMDFMHTNNSEMKTWQQRPTVDDATWTPHGFPVEVMCDLSNRMNIDPWFCMPHLADDDFVRQFALKVRECLNADRKVYIEYSNEVWNGQFAQNKYAARQGQQLGFANKPWEAARMNSLLRSVNTGRFGRDYVRKYISECLRFDVHMYLLRQCLSGRDHCRCLTRTRDTSF